MHRLLLLPLAALAGALVLGCGDQRTPSEPGNTLRPSFRTGQNPEGPGAFVISVPEASFVTVTFDPAPGMTVHVGITYAQHLHLCETGEPPFPMDRLLVFRPDGSIMTRVKGGEVPLVVWQSAPPNPTGNPLADICTEEFLALPHLEGTGRFINTDTDVFLTSHGADASGFTIGGTVADESGNQFHVTVVVRGWVAPGSSLDDFEFILHQFKFQLKPIGG